MSDQYDNFHQILEAAIFAAGEPLSVDRLAQLFDETTRPSTKEIHEALQTIAEFYQQRGVELVEVSNGFRFQAKVDYASWLLRLWEKKPPKYSRALLETLALIAYRQPITRGEIEEIRGVAVSTHITKILQEREWIKIVGYKEVPGKPALFGTTKEFLNYFNLKSLSDLPSLQELISLEEIEEKLGLPTEENEPQQQTLLEATPEHSESENDENDQITQ